jgi:glycosyltransferase involved in cell wall biosynthesis
MNYQEFLSTFEKKEVTVYQDIVTKNPLVSVCVQTFQHAGYIEECLEGILMQQTTFSIEIVLGEDQSTDGTREICMRYAEKYPEKIRLFLHHRENNIAIGGDPSGRFNFVYNLYNARGKYIALCEGDDYWTDPLKLQKQVDFLEGNNNYVCCFHPCNLKIESQPTITKQNIEKIKYDYTIENLLTHWNIPTASIVFRKPKNLQWPAWFVEVASGDIALLMLLFDFGKFKLIEQHMSVYRVTGKGVSMSHKNYRMIHYRAKLYMHLNEYFNFQHEKEIYEALYNLYIRYLNKGNSNTSVNTTWFYSQIRKFFIQCFR